MKLQRRIRELEEQVKLLSSQALDCPLCASLAPPTKESRDEYRYDSEGN